MSNVPSDLKYAKSHEWVRVSGDTAVVGITDGDTLTARCDSAAGASAQTRNPMPPPPAVLFSMTG